MSIDAYRWALKSRVGRSSAKMVLISLADRANENHVCFPSITRLEFDTELNRKTVISSLQYLEGLGLIGIKKELGKGNLYTLIGVEDRHQKTLQDSTSTKNGTTHQTSTNSGTTPVPIQGLDQYQFRDTEPKGTQNKPIKKEKTKKSDFDAITCDLPKAINEQAWREWAGFRKTDKKKAITLSAAQKQIDLLSRYDYETQQDIINQSISSDYQGLFPPKNQARAQAGIRSRTLEQDFTDRSWAN